MRRLFLAAMLGLSGAGCGTGPIHVRSTPTLKAPEHRDDSAAGCAIALGNVRDMRPDAGNLGMMLNRPVSSGDLLLWFSTGLSSRAAPSAQIIVDADLLLLYVQGQASSKSAQLVAHLRYRRGEQVLLEHNYRGRNTGMNWANSESEVQGALDAALNDLLGQMDRDLASLCAVPSPSREQQAAATPR